MVMNNLNTCPRTASGHGFHQHRLHHRITCREEKIHKPAALGSPTPSAHAGNTAIKTEAMSNTPGGPTLAPAIAEMPEERDC